MTDEQLVATNEELVKRLRSYAKDQGGWHNIDDTCEEAADRIEKLEQALKEQSSVSDRLAEQLEQLVAINEAADRIEALTKERDDYAFKLSDANNTYSEMHVELEALTEQLEAARADAKEAEAYAEELAKERDHWQGVAGREGVCMTCHGPRGAPEPYGCSDCLNTGYCGEWHNQMQELREKLAKAVELLKEARQDLEAYVTHDWPKDEHPFYERKWERDMELCRRIDATLAEIEGEKT